MSRAIPVLILSMPVMVLAASASLADPARRLSASPGFAVHAQHARSAAAGFPLERRFERPASGYAQFYTAPVAPRHEPEIVERRAPLRERRVQPLSVNAVDPNAVVARMPSGRTFIGPAPGAYVATPEDLAYYKNGARPYAPPSFHIVGGAASSRHMERPVKLTYGVRPEASLKLGPKVVWLDGRGEAGGDESPHVRHLK